MSVWLALEKLDRWSTCAVIARSRLPQVAATIPTIGYLILWSDGFHNLLRSTKLDIDFSTWRLYAVWWGALLLLIGWIVHVLRCPRPIQRASSAEDYLLIQYNLPDAYRLSSLKDEAKKVADQYQNVENAQLVMGTLTKHALTKAATAPLSDQTRADLLRFEWEFQNQKLPWWRRIAISCLVIGSVLFLIPSLNVALRVIGLLR